jgi:hypothetical protein
LSERGDLRSLLAGLPLSGPFVNSDAEFRLPPQGDTAQTPLDSAIETAMRLTEAAPTPSDAAEMQAYAEALRAVAREEQ